MPHELQRLSVQKTWAGTRVDKDPEGPLVWHRDAVDAIGREANRAELVAEDIECLHMCLDREGVPRKAANGENYSLWGRVLRFKDPKTPDPVEEPQVPPVASLAGICAQCEDSVHPEACPTAYRSCPRIGGRS